MSTRFPRTATWCLPAVALLALASLTSLAAPSSMAVGAAADSKYVGAEKCKSCHSDAAAGDPYGAWEEAAHSKAFETLKSAKAKEVAKAAGVTGDPSEADDCVRCHVTGHGEPDSAFKRGFDKTLGVQCETCHGPGDDHMKARFKAAMAGKPPEGYQGSATEEMIVSPGLDTCVQCHNPSSPTWEPFCFYEARGKIAHLDPRKERTAEEKELFGTCPHGSPCPHAADGCPEGTCNLTPERLTELKKKE